MAYAGRRCQLSEGRAATSRPFPSSRSARKRARSLARSSGFCPLAVARIPFRLAFHLAFVAHVKTHPLSRAVIERDHTYDESRVGARGCTRWRRDPTESERARERGSERASEKGVERGEKTSKRGKERSQRRVLSSVCVVSLLVAGAASSPGCDRAHRMRASPRVVDRSPRFFA